MAAFTLQLFVIFLKIIPLSVWTTECIDAVLKGDLSSVEDVSLVHDCIQSHRDQMLIGAAFLAIGFPTIVSHVYFMKRVLETMLAYLNNGLIGSMYISSWLLVATIYCAFFPALIIFVVYYEWEFSQGLEYVGYAMQFQLFHFLIIVSDSTVIALGVVGSLPWLAQILVACGWMRSAHYRFREDTRQKLLNNIVKCGRFTRVIHLCVASGLIGIILFSSFGDVFDFAKDGFFSYQGKSQYLQIGLLFTWEIQCLLITIMGCRFDKQMTLLNENIESTELELTGLSNADSMKS